VTIATFMPGRPRTLADVHQQVTHDMCQHKALRTWLRDEEAAGSNPATPTTELHVAARFSNQFRSPGYGQSPVWERTHPIFSFPILLTSSNAPCFCRWGGSGLRPLSAGSIPGRTIPVLAPMGHRLCGRAVAVAPTALEGCTMPGIMRGGGIGARPRPDRVRGSGSNSVEPVPATVGL